MAARLKRNRPCPSPESALPVRRGIHVGRAFHSKSNSAGRGEPNGIERIEVFAGRKRVAMHRPFAVPGGERRLLEIALELEQAMPWSYPAGLPAG